MLPSIVNACREPQAHRLWCGRTWNPTSVLSLDPMSQRFLFPPQKVGNVPRDLQYHQ